jgi:hypothetical protein
MPDFAPSSSSGRGREKPGPARGRARVHAVWRMSTCIRQMLQRCGCRTVRCAVVCSDCREICKLARGIADNVDGYFAAINRHRSQIASGQRIAAEPQLVVVERSRKPGRRLVSVLLYIHAGPKSPGRNTADSSQGLDNARLDGRIGRMPRRSITREGTRTAPAPGPRHLHILLSGHSSQRSSASFRWGGSR